MNSNNNKNRSDNTEVLSYKIDTAEFDKGMDRMIAALEKVEKREYLTQLQNSIDGISTGVGTMNFSNMENGLSMIEQRFSTMGVVGMAVIANLTNSVMNFVQQFVVDKMIGDAINGFQELNMQINSTQTILSNTASRFGTTLKDVNTGLDTLNDYADKTIYNFSSMTQAVGAFTSAGIDLGSSIQAIKGVANMAAYAGAGAEAASSGMYQFSNALNMGYMMLYQWRSLMYSGLGTKALEDELVSSARGLGIEVDAIIAEYGSFQYSLESGWATKEVIMHTLAKFAGEVTEDQLRAMKYTDAEIKRIIELGKTATDSATKVVSYEKLVTSLSEAVGSGWAKTFRLIIGDFEEGKKLFTMISDNLLKIIERGAENRNKLAEDWAKFGGRDVVVDSIDKLLKTYNQLLLVLGQSISLIFPPITGEMLANGTKWLGKFIDMLIPTQTGLAKIGRIITGFAATLDIPVQFFKALARYLYDLIKPMAVFKGTWVDSIVGFADFMTKLRNEIVKGDLFYKKITEWGDSFKLFLGKIKKFLDDVGKLDAVKKMKDIFNAITMKLGIKDPKFLSTFLSDAQKSFAAFFASFDKVGALATINKFIGAIIGFGKDVYKFLEPVITYVLELVGNFAKAFGLAMKDLTTNFTWDKFKDVLGIFTKFLTLKTITTILERFGYASEIFLKLGMGLGETIGYIGNAIKQFVNSNDADTFMSIAIALGILSASVFMLATLPQGDINKGIAAITAIYAGMAGSLLALNKILNGPDTVQNMIASSSKLALLPPVLIALAGSILMMSYALAKLGELPMKQLVKGFGALVGILLALEVFLILNKKWGGMTASTGLGLIGLALSVVVLAKAFKLLADVKWEDMGKAAVALGGIVLIMVLMSKAEVSSAKLIVFAVAVAAMSGAISLLALSFKYLASIDWPTMDAGLTNLLVMLGGLYGALWVGEKITAKTIAKLGLSAIALAGLGLAFILISKIDPLKVILAAGAISIAVAALCFVVSKIPPTITAGVLGLLQLSGGLAAFAVSLLLFKDVDFKKVLLAGVALAVLIAALIGLGALALSFPPLVVALTAISGVLVAAGGAFMLFGAGVLFAGSGFKFLAEGLVLLADAGTRIIDSFIKNLPKFGEAVLKFIITLSKIIEKAGPLFTAMASVLMISIAQGIIFATPWILAAAVTVTNAFYDFFDRTGEELYSILGRWFMRMLVDLEENVGTYAVLWNNIQTKFINGMAETSAPVVEAWYNYFIVMFGSLADTIEKDGDRMRAAWRRLVIVMIKYLYDGFVEASEDLDKCIKWVFDYINTNMSKEATATSDIIAGIGKNFISGLILGMLDPTGLIKFGAAIQTVVTFMLDMFRAGLLQHSPSRKAFEIGDFFMQGLSNGLDPSMLTSKLTKIKDTMLSFMDGSLKTDLNFQPTLSPVLDMGAMSAIEKTIASAFGSQQFSLGMSPGFSLGSGPAVLVGQGLDRAQTVYNQYNTSASPLSVEEVARRTASLIGQNRR